MWNFYLIYSIPALKIESCNNLDILFKFSMIMSTFFFVLKIVLYISIIERITIYYFVRIAKKKFGDFKS